jgi:hypothetical protein
LTSAKAKLDSVFDLRMTEISRSLEALSTRLAAVESDFGIEREKYIAEISEKTAVVSRDIYVMQNLINKDRLDNADVEAQFVKRIAELDLKHETELRSSCFAVEKRLTSLRDSISDYRSERDKGDQKFQAFVLEEIAGFKNSLVIETQSREQSDDDIIRALNHYTKALQDALRLVNSS